MTRFDTRFFTDDSGAVTVDWTVLGASVVGIGLAATAAVRTGVINLGDDVNTALSNASVASVMNPHAHLNLSSPTGYLDMTFYFFTEFGRTNWYNRNVRNLSDDALLTALATREIYRDAEMAMGPDQPPSYGEPWGHTDMYNLTYWEAARRGLI